MSKEQHNPHNLIIGQRVVLDKGYSNSSEVVIKDFTPMKIITTVTDGENSSNEWQVLTYRLSPLQIKEPVKS